MTQTRYSRCLSLVAPHPSRTPALAGARNSADSPGVHGGVSPGAYDVMPGFGGRGGGLVGGSNEIPRLGSGGIGSGKMGWEWAYD
jgi:hypothetical protein